MPDDTCKTCGGTKQVSRLVAIRDGEPISEMRPCPDCTPAVLRVPNCATCETVAELCADVVVLRAQVAELKAQNVALGRWQCAECGGRFEELPDVPNVVMDGIKRCSPCVERQIYREKLDAAKVLVAELEAEIEDLQHLASASLDTRPHAEPADCPSWHDGCNCTVEALECAIERGDRAEAKLQAQIDHATAGWHEAILDALRSYRCQYTVDHDGDGLDLVDVLSAGPTIAEGQAELELLADTVASAVAPALAALLLGPLESKP